MFGRESTIQFTTVQTADDVSGILELQRRNLASALTPEAIASQGFVTVRHDENVLRRMNDAAPSIVARAGGHVIALDLRRPPRSTSRS
jgi:hypothetical protein